MKKKPAAKRKAAPRRRRPKLKRFPALIEAELPKANKESFSQSTLKVDDKGRRYWHIYSEGDKDATDLAPGRGLHLDPEVWPPGTIIRAFTPEECEPQPWMCEHANENPNVCLCPPGCYCRTRTCKAKALAHPCVECGVMTIEEDGQCFRCWRRHEG